MNTHLANSLDLLLERLFDYAGMFPPASRSFEAALTESCSFQKTLKRPEMIASDIVLDTEHAHKLRGVNLGSYSARNPFRVCMLATEDPERVLEEALQLTRKEPPVVVTAIEVKATADTVVETLEQYGSFCASHGVLLCVEPNLSGESWREILDTTIEALQGSRFRPALKCRLTGPTALSAERFADAIIAANSGNVPLKVTGGLHHPIVEPERYPFQMGFLNVSVAVMLHRHFKGRIESMLLQEMLTNQESEAFTFGKRLGYKNFLVSLDELKRVKDIGNFTIGSCSIHEPDEDLCRLFPSD
jgi:hypothetical protein